MFGIAIAIAGIPPNQAVPLGQSLFVVFLSNLGFDESTNHLAVPHTIAGSEGLTVLTPFWALIFGLREGWCTGHATAAAAAADDDDDDDDDDNDDDDTFFD